MKVSSFAEKMGTTLDPDKVIPSADEKSKAEELRAVLESFGKIQIKTNASQGVTVLETKKEEELTEILNPNVTKKWVFKIIRDRKTGLMESVEAEFFETSTQF